MLKNKFFLFLFPTLILTGCSSVDSIIPSLSSNSIPTAIQDVVASRVNPESELYALSSATISKSGSIVAQSQANKEASSNLKNQIKKEVENLYKGRLGEMDAFSKSIISPVTSDLSNYATDLVMKKVTQKGAWEDDSKIYSLLSVNKSEITGIAEKVFQNFIDNATKKLENFGSKK